jgi:hypothetical protein
MSNVQSVSTRRDRTDYTGKLSDFQQLGNTFKEIRYAEFERDPFNDHQNFLYKRALFGLKVYTQDELSSMHQDKRNRIIRVYSRTQKVLNLFKQEVVNAKTNELFSLLFPKSPITKDLTENHNYTDPKFINTISFKDLGVSKHMLVERLILEKILPHNFYNLAGNE